MSSSCLVVVVQTRVRDRPSLDLPRIWRSLENAVASPHLHQICLMYCELTEGEGVRGWAAGAVRRTAHEIDVRISHLIHILITHH